jgi:hypothetical protein
MYAIHARKQAFVLHQYTNFTTLHMIANSLLTMWISCFLTTQVHSEARAASAKAGIHDIECMLKQRFARCQPRSFGKYYLKHSMAKLAISFASKPSVFGIEPST